MVTTPGTWRQVLKVGTTAVIKPRAGAKTAKENSKPSDVEKTFVDHKSKYNEEQPPPYNTP